MSIAKYHMPVICLPQFLTASPGERLLTFRSSHGAVSSALVISGRSFPGIHCESCQALYDA
jgi:hypothetical protein